MATTTVEGMGWSKFLPWFAGRWQPGEHVALVGPTGRGKTNSLIQLVKTRPKVVLLDAKGGDSTLRKSGFEVTKTWPPTHKRTRRAGDAWHGRDDRDPPSPMRFLYSPPVKTMADYDLLAVKMRAVLEHVFTERGWTIGIDEARISSDVLGLKDEMLKLLITARDRGTSVVVAFQAPRYVLRESLDQVSWVFAWPVRDRDTQGRIAEVLGEDRSSIREVLETLSFHDVLVLDVPDDRLIITRPTKA